MRTAKALLLILFTFTPNAQAQQDLVARKYSAMVARPTEEWVKRGIIYEIYPRAFSPEGTFTGIEKRLPELRRLSVTILWLMPIHPIGLEKRKGTLGSPYSVSDYYAVSPEYGTLEDFKRLLTRAHELGFHFIIDLVANHTSWDSKLVQEHPDWFSKDSSGRIVSPNPDWHDVADLDYTNRDLRRYMVEMMKYWVRDVGIDGFRCDVSELVPTDFWDDARAALDSIKPVLMLSEGSLPEHHVRAFDITYSWDLYHSLLPIMRGEMTARAIDRVLAEEEVKFPQKSLRLRFSSNHDETAWDNPDVVKLGMAGAKLAAVLVNTLPGVPLLYNGQEVGNTVKLGLFEKFSIDWSKNPELKEFYASLFYLRTIHPALWGGEMIRIESSNDRRVYAFLRISGSDKVLVVFNFENADYIGSVTLSHPKFTVEKQVTLRDVLTNRLFTIALPPEKTIPVTVPAMGFLILAIE